MDDEKDQSPQEPAFYRPDSAAIPEELLARRMSRLRENARSAPGMRELIYDTPASAGAMGHSPRRWLMAGAAAGVAMAIGGLVFALMPRGDSGSNTPADSNSNPPQAAAPAPGGSGQAPAAATATPSPQPSATIAAPTPVPGEGAASGTPQSGKPSVDAPIIVSPVDPKPRVVDRFGTSRGTGLYHAGIDMDATTTNDFDAVAACEGTVGGSDHSSTLGNYVVVDCSNGWRTVYGELSSVSVKAGQSVSIGLSVVGHVKGILHFEVRFQGTTFDPLLFIDFNVHPGAPTPTDTPAPTDTPEHPTTTPGGSSGGNGGGETPTSVTTKAPPTATPVPPTATPVPPTATPTPKSAKPKPTPYPGAH